MLNKSGIFKTDCATPKQILADPSLQFSIGCIVPAELENSKAGTPICVDLDNINKACKQVNNSTTFANAVLLHDVDVSNGQTNGTALIFGFVDLNKVDTKTQILLKTALSSENATKLITLVNYNG